MRVKILFSYTQNIGFSPDYVDGVTEIAWMVRGPVSPSNPSQQMGTLYTQMS